MSEFEWLKEFGATLTVMMEETGYTQKDLAEDTGLSESTISRYANGTAIPKATALVNIASALSCTVDELVDFNEDIDF